MGIAVSASGGNPRPSAWDALPAYGRIPLLFGPRASASTIS